MPFASRVAEGTLRLLPRKRLSRALGSLAARAPARAVLAQAIDLYVRAYRVDLTEAVVPPGGWRSFDEFFTRTLRAGSRPIAGGDETMVSPADGALDDAGPIERNARLVVKGHSYDVGALLGDPSDAERFEGGGFAVVYLSPRDYHRVHASVAGPVELVRHVGGTLWPVNEFGSRSMPDLLAKNERVVVTQRRPKGEVATVLVGAIGVGRISVSFDPAVMTNVGRGPTTIRYDPGSAPRLARADEIGMFHLGSTVVMLWTADLQAKLQVRKGQRVQMGQALAVEGG